MLTDYDAYKSLTLLTMRLNGEPINKEVYMQKITIELHASLWICSKQSVMWELNREPHHLLPRAGLDVCADF